MQELIRLRIHSLRYECMDLPCKLCTSFTMLHFGEYHEFYIWYQRHPSRAPMSQAKMVMKNWPIFCWYNNPSWPLKILYLVQLSQRYKEIFQVKPKQGVSLMPVPTLNNTNHKYWEMCKLSIEMCIYKVARKWHLSYVYLIELCIFIWIMFITVWIL